MAELRMTHRHATEDELQQLRHNGFAAWFLSYVDDGLAKGFVFDDWIREIVRGPNFVVRSYPKYCTRGYAFTRKVLTPTHMMLVFRLLPVMMSTTAT
ncbi:hypothetical protein Bca4012_027282 [Brassica carinata]